MKYRHIGKHFKDCLSMYLKMLNFKCLCRLNYLVFGTHFKSHFEANLWSTKNTLGFFQEFQIEVVGSWSSRSTFWTPKGVILSLIINNTNPFRTHGPLGGPSHDWFSNSHISKSKRRIGFEQNRYPSRFFNFYFSLI